MKKLTVGLFILGFFLVPQVSRAQDASWLSQMESLLKGLSVQVNGMQLAAVGTSRADVANGGCASTMMPAGSNGQTVRCNGREWVAAGNLLNDGANLGLGVSPDTNIMFNTKGDRSNSLINAFNQGSGSGIFGVAYQDGAGVGGQSMHGLGLLGRTSSGSGVRGEADSGIAVEAISVPGSTGYGIKQAGSSVKNYFEAPLYIGEIPDSYVDSHTQVNVSGPGSRVEINSTGNNFGGPQIVFRSNGEPIGGISANVNTFTNESFLTLGPAGVKVGISSLGIHSPGGLRVNSNNAPTPTCNTERRGQLWFHEGANGEKDTMRVCAKDAAGSYAWRVLY